uniref:RNA-directed DNA polymerase n=1 Tax=Fagus sylvatica TaxID=28930 RepID=A0A2N9HT66_FAGSY
MDQRVEQLEQNMSSLMSSNQQLMEKMFEIYAKLSTIPINREEGEGSYSRSKRRTEGRGHTDGGLNNNHQYTPRIVKLDFPRFNGAEDPTSWICRAEQFFRFHETPIEDHVALALFHLEGEAQLWYQLLQQEAESLNWPTFKAGLLARYGPTQFFNHFGELTKLQQIVSCFVSGLKEGIKADVLAGRPVDLSTAIGLARLYEARNSSFRRTTAPISPINKMPPFSPRKDTKPRSSFPLKRLTPTELKERREKGLCYNCNERDGPETMRVAGLIQAVPTTILLDFGSSHNFVSESLARKLQLHPVKGPRIRVMLASGEKLANKGVGSYKIGNNNSTTYDLVDYTTNWEDHLKHLETTLAILKNHNLFVKLGKCYGKIAAPLTQMLRKNSFNWSEKAVASFEKLKVSMTQAPVLALPDFSRQFVVECDASGSGIGAVLRQDQPIAFHSQALHGKNLLMSTYEKEMLALVMAVLKWKHYLLSRKFVVRTDQKSLQYLWSQKIATKAQQKWLYKLMGFDFSIEYKRGSENKVADVLSRRTEGPNEEQLMAFSSPVPHWVDAIREEQQVRSQLQQLIQRVQSGEAVGPWKVRDGLLLFKDRIYVDTDSPLKQDIINQFHASSHEGFHKTFQRVHSNFYWLKMREDIKTFIRECEICQKHKVEQLSPAGLLQPLPIPHKVFFENIFKLHDMPRTIVCDRDVTFTSGFWIELFHLNGTSFNFSSAYHPQTDGQTKVVNRTLEMYLRCFTSDKPKQWVRWLCWAEFCYNTSWHLAIKRTHFEVVYGREPPSLLTYVLGIAKVAAVEDELLQRDLVLADLKENIKVAQERMKRSYDSKHCEKIFEVGNWVYLRLRPYRQVSVAMRRNAKLSPWFYGPFRILQRIGQVAYKLELPSDTRIHPVFHVSLLKEKLGSKISVQPQLPLLLEIIMN